MARKWLPDNVTEYRDRHGKTRYRFRKAGLPTYGFRHEPGTKKFLEELDKARNAVAERLPRFAPYSYDELINHYYATESWTESSDATQKTYRNIIERFRADNGSIDVRVIRPVNISKKLQAMRDTPAAANNLRKVLKRLHRLAVEMDWRTDNPADATRGYRRKSNGFHTWTDAELAAFDAKWPYGSKERLAKELLLATATRKSDAIRLGPANLIGNELHILHTKNDSGTILPVLPELRAALDSTPTGPETFLVTQFGKPYSSTGFYNWFKRACVKAGVGHCSPHGLRKAMSRRLAESGATVLEGRSVTGHKTDKEFARYAEKADQRKLSRKAMANLPNGLAKEEAE